MSLKNKMPILSIIITSKNTEKYIAQSVDSIVSQKFYSPEKIEIIVVDDLSDDNTINVIENLSSRKYFKVIQNNHSCGPGGSRNIGLREATGRYVAYLDGDDFFSDNYLSALYPYLEETKYEILVFNYSRFHDGDNRVYEKSNVGVEIDTQYTAAWNKVVKRSLALKSLFLEDNVKWEDVYYTVVLNMNSKSINLIPESLYFYRRRMGSLSYDHNDIQGHEDIVRIFQSLVSKYSLHVFKESSELRKLFNKQFFAHAILAIGSNPNDMVAHNVTTKILRSFRVLNSKKIPIYGTGLIRFIKNNFIMALLKIKLYSLANAILKLTQ